MGQKLGWDWLTYNPVMAMSFHEIAVRAAPRFVDAALTLFPGTRSVCDVGCGSGGYLAEFQRRGMRVMGCEYSPRARRWAASLGVTAHPFHLPNTSGPLPGAPYDLVMSIEVAEHVPEPLADDFAGYLAAQGETIVLTAAQPGQGGTGHINEQPKSYWIEKLERLDRQFDQAAAQRMVELLDGPDVPEWVRDNLMVFRKK